MDMNKCSECGTFFPDDDIVILRAPDGFADEHITDHIPIVMVWHRGCFEKNYGIKLPEFKS